MDKKYITSIGEILFDVYGNDKRIGGAPFNFIYHVNKLMGNTNFITSVGNDNYGKEILNFLDGQNISQKYVIINDEKPTGRVIVDLNEKKVPEFNIEENTAYDFIKLSDSEIDKIVNESQLVYFGSLCQRNEISRQTIQNLVSKCSKSMFDINLRQNYFTKEIVIESLKECSILKINEDELKVISELIFENGTEYKDNIIRLQNKFDIDFISITKGELGAEIFSKEGQNFCKAPKVNAVDTVGAGDAYSSILAVGILNQLDLEKTNYLAVSFAAEIIEQQGALIFDDEIYMKYREKINNE